MVPLALIIEDDHHLANIFGTTLETVDFETEIIMDGEEALNRLKEIVPTVVLLDLNLPIVSGKTLLENIRADKRLADTKVVIVTADVESGIEIQDQANYVLLKPVEIAKLREVAQRLRR